MGSLLGLVNHVAAEVETKFPDVLVGTLAMPILVAHLKIFSLAPMSRSNSRALNAVKSMP